MGTTVAVLERHRALAELGVATIPLDVGELARRTGLQPAYTHLAMHLLATQGLAAIVRHGRATAVALTPAGRVWARHAAAYDRFEDILDRALALRAALRGEGDAAAACRAAASARASRALRAAPAELAERLRAHRRGPLFAVAVRELAGVRAFARIARAPLGWCPLDALPLHRPALDACIDLLADAGWLARDEDLVRLTPAGLVAARWAPLYGYLEGYMRILRRVPAVLGLEGAAGADAARVTADEDRDLLLAGKAQVFARGGLRGPLEEMVLEVFEREPLETQPRAVLDMSAGDGSVLQALHHGIAERTRRGAALARHPLALVGIVGNRLARERAAARLGGDGVPCLLLSAPLEEPDAIAAELARAGLDLKDALVVSKTCIHGRRYVGANGTALPARDGPPSTAVFVTPEGELVAPEDLEDDLAAFFSRWARWTPRHGMVAVDAHTVAPEVAAQSHAVNVMTHVCATHGYSAQYLVEAPVFRRAARRAGLESRSARDLGTELIGAPTMTIDRFVPRTAGA